MLILAEIEDAKVQEVLEDSKEPRDSAKTIIENSSNWGYSRIVKGYVFGYTPFFIC